MNDESRKTDFYPIHDFCLLDNSGIRYSCVHKGNCNEKSNCIKNCTYNEELDFHKYRFHPADRLLWCEETFPDILKFIDSEPEVGIPDYRIIFNHRYIRNDGSISQFMHEGSISFTEDKLLPVLNLKVFFQIGDELINNTILLTIFKYSEDTGYMEVFTRLYGSKSYPKLTDREREVIHLCYEGMSSKMIAEKLKLSIHTIKNHKRKCMEKTMTHNITELVYCCLKNNWLS